MTHITDEGTEILRVLCGSRAYGLESADSDFDYHGVYVVPTSRILVLGDRIKETQWVEGTDTDNTAWELRHFLELAVHCNPTILETFVAPVEASTEAGDLLRGLFPHVLARKRIYDAFRGYAKNQRTKMFDDSGGVRYLEKHVKFAVAYLRSLHHGIVLLREGTYDPYIHDTELRDFLLGLKSAVELDYGAVVNMAAKMGKQLTAAYMASTLPEEPNLDAINDYLLAVRRRFW